MDSGGLRWIQVVPGGPRLTQVDPGGPRWTQVDPGFVPSTGNWAPFSDTAAFGCLISLIFSVSPDIRRYSTLHHPPLCPPLHSLSSSAVYLSSCLIKPCSYVSCPLLSFLCPLSYVAPLILPHRFFALKLKLHLCLAPVISFYFIVFYWKSLS